MQNKKTTNGFSAALVTAVAIGLLLVGAISWRLISQRQSTVHSDTTATSSAPAPEAAPSSGQTALKPSSSKSLNVKELGFTIALPDGLGDLQYVIDNSVAGASAAYFTTATLVRADGGSSCSAKDHPLGAIVRYSIDPRSIGAAVAKSKALSSFYLGLVKPQQGCSQDEAVVELQAKQT